MRSKSRIVFSTPAHALHISEVTEGQEIICRQILDDLPEWFGIPEAKSAYITASAKLPMLAANFKDETVGFVSLKHHTDFAAELYLVGVKRRFHRHGIGRRLIRVAENFAKTNRLTFLTVKTLAASKPDPGYASTRKFYEAVGFVPIEVFPTLWDAANPCLLMIKAVR